MNKSILDHVNKIVAFHETSVITTTKYVIDAEPRNYDVLKAYDVKLEELLLMHTVAMIISFVTILKALRTLVYYRYEK
uniref:GOLD domain-containing protein n=1 Tax=Parastrongyloides trichosuri TaxID=131310 RepID=A0A0N4ZF37_PARTI